MSRHGPYRSAPSYPAVHRNPWSGGAGVLHCSDSRSSGQSSGSGGHSYHVLGGGPCPPSYYHDLPPSADHHHHHHQPPPPPPPLRESLVVGGGGGGYRGGAAGGGRHPLESAGGGACLLPQESSGKYLLSRERGVPVRPPPSSTAAPPPPPPLILDTQPTLDNGRRSRPVSSRAATPVGGPEAAAVIVPCGGHCAALETFCHYFLQVAFLGGVVSGLCLVVAGRVASRELSVLTYIGSLTSLVCGALLWVQCLVRRGPRRRPHRPPPHPHPHHPEAIPLQNLQPPPYTLRPLPEHLEFRGLPRCPGRGWAAPYSGGWWYIVQQKGREWYTMVEEGDHGNVTKTHCSPSASMLV